MKKFYLFFFILILISNSNAQNHFFPILRDNPKQANIGKNLYETYCSSCHQANLSGQKNWKTELDKDGHRLAPPLNGTGHTWHHDDHTLFKIIKYGLTGLVKNYEGKMVGFENNLKDDEIVSILVYIKTFWKDEVYAHQIGSSKKH